MMTPSGPHSRILGLALETVGTARRLAVALDISEEELAAYMSSKEPLPNSLFLACLDIVANGKRTP